MFALNLQSWGNSDFIRANYSPDSMPGLEQAPMDIAAGESSACEILAWPRLPPLPAWGSWLISAIEWMMRQRAWLKE